MNAEIVWRKSSRSTGQGQCVEVATLPDRVMVRDSKNPDGPTLSFTRSDWRAFVHGIDTGEFTRS